MERIEKSPWTGQSRLILRPSLARWGKVIAMVVVVEVVVAVAATVLRQGFVAVYVQMLYC